MPNSSLGLMDVLQNGTRATSPKVTEEGQTPPPHVRVTDPCIMVIFGASGDLATRKLIPAIYTLARSRLLPDEFAILGIAREQLSREEFQNRTRECIRSFVGSRELDPPSTDWMIKRVYYLASDAVDESRYDELADTLHDLDQTWHTPGNYLYYLPTLPSLFATIVKLLGNFGLARQEPGKWRRVVIEKPFGTD